MKNIILGLLLVFSSLTTSFAGTVTTAPKSTATLSSFCSLSVPDIVFGLVTPGVGKANQFIPQTMTVLCSKGVAYSLILGFGNNGAARLFNTDSRYVKGVTSGNKDVLQYNICSDGAGIACNTVWGNSAGSGTGKTVAGTGTGDTQNINYTATIQQASFITPDIYTDTLVMTLNF